MPLLGWLEVRGKKMEELGPVKGVLLDDLI